MPVTEIFSAPLKSDVDIQDASSDAGLALAEVLNLMRSDSNVLRILWGARIEEPRTLDFAIDWKSLELQRAFVASPQFAELSALMPRIFGGPPTIYMVDWIDAKDHKKVAGNGLVSELVTLYFSADMTGAQRDDFFSNGLAPMWNAIKAMDNSGCHGMMAGWSVSPEQLDVDGQPARVFREMLGWDSLEHHNAFMATEAFRKALEPLMATKGLLKWSITHVAYNEVDL